DVEGVALLGDARAIVLQVRVEHPEGHAALEVRLAQLLEGRNALPGERTAVPSDEDDDRLPVQARELVGTTFLIQQDEVGNQGAALTPERTGSDEHTEKEKRNPGLSSHARGPGYPAGTPERHAGGGGRGVHPWCRDRPRSGAERGILPP